MGQAETLIEEAIQYAKSRGVKVVRGAMFNWCAGNYPHDIHWANYPVSCNAIGAVLLKIGKENLVKEDFDPLWLKTVCNYLGVDGFWVWKFVSGFDYGNELNLTHVKKQGDKKEETKETDKVSRYANVLARRHSS